MFKLAGWIVASLPALGCAIRPVCKVPDESRFEPVAYCDLLEHAKDYDGHPILTEAIWYGGFHTDFLFDPRCPRIHDRAAQIQPGLPEDRGQRKELAAMLESDGAAIVDVAGVFHSGEGPHGEPTGQPTRVDVSCILNLRRPPKKL